MNSRSGRHRKTTRFGTAVLRTAAGGIAASCPPWRWPGRHRRPRTPPDGSFWWPKVASYSLFDGRCVHMSLTAIHPDGPDQISGVPHVRGPTLIS